LGRLNYRGRRYRGRRPRPAGPPSRTHLRLTAWFIENNILLKGGGMLQTYENDARKDQQGEQNLREVHISEDIIA
jgi:hypothetical protein